MSVWKQNPHKHSKCLSSPFFKLSFTPDTSPPPMLLLWVTFNPSGAAANGTGFGVRTQWFLCCSEIFSSVPLLVLHGLQTLQYQHCHGEAPTHLTLLFPCSLLFPLSSACPAFLPFLKHTFLEVSPCHLSGSTAP